MHAIALRVWFVSGVILLLAAGCTQTQSMSSDLSPGDLAGDADARIQPTTYFAHGHLLERQGNFERAAEQYRKALTLQPNFVTARNRLGITLNKLGKHAEASAEFRRAIAAKPQLAFLHNNLGFSLYLEGKYTDAEAATRKALELKPSFSRARMNRALALAKLGRFDDAFGELRQVGSEADAHYNLALLQTEARQYAAAARSLDAALRMNPKLEAARQQLREVSLLAAQQETVAVADVTTPAEPEPAPAPSVTESTSDAVANEDPATGDALVETPEAVEPQPEPDEAEVVMAEESPEPAVPMEPTGPSLDDLLPGNDELAWESDPEPFAPATDDADGEVGTADFPETTPQADSQTSVEKLQALISAIVSGSQERIAQLWCELEASVDADDE